MPIPIVLRLFLPDTWIKAPERLQRAGVPEAFWAAALEAGDRPGGTRTGDASGRELRGGGGDAGYGISAPFRQGLSALGLLWAVGIPRIQKVYPPDVRLVPPPVTRGGPRKTLIPDQEAIAAEAMLAKSVLAADHLAARHQGSPAGEVRGRAGAGGRWA